MFDTKTFLTAITTVESAALNSAYHMIGSCGADVSANVLHCSAVTLARSKLTAFCDATSLQWGAPVCALCHVARVAVAMLCAAVYLIECEGVSACGQVSAALQGLLTPLRFHDDASGAAGCEWWNTHTAHITHVTIPIDLDKYLEVRRANSSFGDCTLCSRENSFTSAIFMEAICHVLDLMGGLHVRDQAIQKCIAARFAALSRPPSHADPTPHIDYQQDWTMPTFSALPWHIVKNILSFLGPIDVARARRVSREFYNVASGLQLYYPASLQRRARARPYSTFGTLAEGRCTRYLRSRIFDTVRTLTVYTTNLEPDSVPYLAMPRGYIYADVGPSHIAFVMGDGSIKLVDRLSRAVTTATTPRDSICVGVCSSACGIVSLHTQLNAVVIAKYKAGGYRARDITAMLPPGYYTEGFAYCSNTAVIYGMNAMSGCREVWMFATTAGSKDAVLEGAPGACSVVQSTWKVSAVHNNGSEVAIGDTGGNVKVVPFQHTAALVRYSPCDQRIHATLDPPMGANGHTGQSVALDKDKVSPYGVGSIAMQGHKLAVLYNPRLQLVSGEFVPQMVQIAWWTPSNIVLLQTISFPSSNFPWSELAISLDGTKFIAFNPACPGVSEWAMCAPKNKSLFTGKKTVNQ